MPQIANQDYNVLNDVSYLGYAGIAGAIYRGTIFDSVIMRANQPTLKIFARPITIKEQIIPNNPNKRYTIFCVEETNRIISIQISHTQEQYIVLYEMENGDMDPGDISVTEDGYINGNDTDLFVCADGKYVAVTTDSDGYINSYRVTDVEAVGVTPVNIPEEDLPGLIGLFAGN